MALIFFIQSYLEEQSKLQKFRSREKITARLGQK